MKPEIGPVRAYFMSLQDRICDALEDVDGGGAFLRRELSGDDGALARPRVLEGGTHIEKAAVQFTHSIGRALPPAASARNPDLAGRAFQATAISLIVHPVNPYAPTTHMNLRYFTVESDPVTWYFGGGFDLTPCYGFDEDAAHFHRTAREACAALGADVYPRLKQACDEYFFLPHRNEPRGVGGLFFDDWVHGGFDTSFAFVRSVGDHFLPAYRPLLERRLGTPFGEREREFQCYRRGRYAEFNLAIDRGTRYGLESGRRVESVLASLPPVVHWRYDHRPDPGTPEARLYERYLVPRDWANLVDNSGD